MQKRTTMFRHNSHVSVRGTEFFCCTALQEDHDQTLQHKSGEPAPFGYVTDSYEIDFLSSALLCFTKREVVLHALDVCSCSYLKRCGHRARLVVFRLSRSIIVVVGNGSRFPEKPRVHSLKEQNTVLATLLLLLFLLQHGK